MPNIAVLPLKSLMLLARCTLTSDLYDSPRFFAITSASCNQSAGSFQTDTFQKRRLVEWSRQRGGLASDECGKRGVLLTRHDALVC